MNYERWGQSLGTDVMPATPMLTQPAFPTNTSTSTGAKPSSGTVTPQLVTMLPQIIGAVAQGVAQGTQQPGLVPSNVPVQPDTGVPELPCSDGYYRDAQGLCQIMPPAPPPPIVTQVPPPIGQPLPGTASNVAAPTTSYVMPIATFVGGCLVGAVAMHLYMGPKKSVTSNRGRRPRRNRRRARR